MVFTDSHPYNVRRSRVVQHRRSPEVVNEMVARHKRTKRSMGCVKKADNEDNASAFYMALLASYWFASSAQTLACSMLIIPYQILKMVGLERKGTYLGLTMLFSSIVTVISGPLSGTLSDRSKLPFGRRRVFILVGTLIKSLIPPSHYPLPSSFRFTSSHPQKKIKKKTTIVIADDD